jgi:hypothetical protein
MYFNVSTAVAYTPKNEYNIALSMRDGQHDIMHLFAPHAGGCTKIPGAWVYSPDGYNVVNSVRPRRATAPTPAPGPTPAPAHDPKKRKAAVAGGVAAAAVGLVAAAAFVFARRRRRGAGMALGAGGIPDDQNDAKLLETKMLEGQ